MKKATLVMGMLSVALMAPPAQAIAPTAPVYCAQLRGAEKPDCTFKTLGECRASVKTKGGGHCYKLHR